MRVTKALLDVLKERQEQIEKHGFDKEHDDENGYFDMSNFAAMYLMSASNTLTNDVQERLFPFGWDIKWFKNGSQRQSLVKAAALILAELESWDREDDQGESLETENLTFLQELRLKNKQRQAEWPSDIEVDELFRSNELAEEAGEVCGAVKKLYRDKYNIAGNKKPYTELFENLMEEVGDLMITLDLLAEKYGLDIEKCTKMKFNQTSENNGLTTKF